MTIHDIRELPPSTSLKTDICIIGAGPAGISIALQFAQAQTSVIVVESGGLSREPEIEALNEIESVGIRRARQDATRCRGLGGTSALWSGRCSVFDSTDFQRRPWVPDSGWPIAYADVAPFLDRAGRMLGLGPGLYCRDQWGTLPMNKGNSPWDAAKFLPVVFQASRHDGGDDALVRDFAEAGVEGAEFIGALQHAGAPKPRHFGEYYRPVLQASKNIDVYLHANVTEIETDETGKVATSVRLGTQTGKTYRVFASQIVLACGGIDNARLLLASRSRNSRGVGNDHDVVGRYLMDHPFAALSTYIGEGSPELRRRLGPFWFDYGGTRRVFTQGLRLHPELQRQNGLLNCAIYMVEFGDEPSPISRLGSALRLAKCRQFNSSFWRDIRAAMGDPRQLMSGIADRYVYHRPSLNRPTRVVFGANVEQLPDRHSRLTLSDEIDALGMPRAKIDWRAADLEYETARFFANAVQKEFARLGYKQPVLSDWLDQGAEAYRSVIHDMSHPMGATRMSPDPSRGVVNQNCAVHGVDNLFIAGGSTFSTSGYANPTLMIVSLALRLADHLKARMSQSVVAQHRVSCVLPVRQRCKIGIVGAGDRIRRIYAPIFKAFANDYDIVGVTSRTNESALRIAEQFGAKTFASAEDLARHAEPHFLLVAVPDALVEKALDQLTLMDVPILVETPFAWNVQNGRRLLKRIRERNLLVGVAEQTPFLPHEQLKQHLIDLGLIGEVLSAHNDFYFYAYHGLAGLRAYLGSSSRPHYVSTARVRCSAPKESSIVQASVAHHDGKILRHCIGDAPEGFDPKITVTGSSGKIVNDVVYFDGTDGSTVSSKILRHCNEEGALVSLTVDTPLGEVRWRNPYQSQVLSDEQYAVAQVLWGMSNAVHFGGWAQYDAARAHQDMELLTAMRYSQAMGGQPIKLPIRPIVGAIRSKIALKVGGRL